MLACQLVQKALSSNVLDSHVAFRLFGAPRFDGVIPNRGHVLNRFGTENIPSHAVQTFGKQ